MDQLKRAYAASDASLELLHSRLQRNSELWRRGISNAVLTAIWMLPDRATESDSACGRILRRETCQDAIYGVFFGADSAPSCATSIQSIAH
jgi:hypothetical protein